MFIADDGQFCGSVSGGCVEGAVIESGRRLIESQECQLLSFGSVTQEKAWELGLSCGGGIRVFVQPCSELFFREVDQMVKSACFARIDLTGNEPMTLLSQDINDGESYCIPFLGTRRMIVIGGSHIGVALVQLANTLGFETIVIDPREAFCELSRYPSIPDKVIGSWPDKALESLTLGKDCCGVVLTHNPTIDDPALEYFLKNEMGYIGALGSKITHENRCQRLREKGFPIDQLERIHAPAGLKIWSQTPEEIALSILAEIVATLNGK